MEIRAKENEGIRVLVLSGRLGIDGGDALLREKFLELYDAGERQFIFDLRHLQSIDSAGLGEIIACQKRIGPAPGSIRMVLDRSSKIYDFVLTTHLDSVFRVFTDEDAARASFTTDSPAD